MNVFLRNARARTGHVEATLNHPFPAQVIHLNTQLLEAAFDDAPWDDVATLDDAKRALGLSRVSRHVTSPAGSDDWRGQVRAVHNTLSGVKGELNAFPTHFLHGETLAPSLLAKMFVGRRLFQ